MRFRYNVVITFLAMVIGACSRDGVQPLRGLLEDKEVQGRLSDWVEANIVIGEALSDSVRFSPAGNHGRYIVDVAFDWSIFGSSVHGNEIKIVGDLKSPVAVVFYFEENVSVVFALGSTSSVAQSSGLYADVDWLTDRIGLHEWGRD